jgi:hypothetical protein
VLLSILYVAFYRGLQLILLLFRSTEYKELEIVVLRHELAVLRRLVKRPPLLAADRWFLAAAARMRPRVRWEAFLVTPAASLAPSTRRETMDVRPTTRSTGDRPGGASADQSARSRESALGLSAHCWRAERPWRRRVSHHRQGDPPSGTARAGWKAAGADVAPVPAFASGECYRR